MSAFIRRSTAAGGDPVAPEAEGRDWIRCNLGRWHEGAGYSFAVADTATGRAVGGAGLWLAELPKGRASAGYAVAPVERGHGYGADAPNALTAFAWTLAGLHRVELHIEPWNGASVRTAERAGYTLEGLMRSHQEIGGSRRDRLLYAAVRPDGRRPA